MNQGLTGLYETAIESSLVWFAHYPHTCRRHDVDGGHLVLILRNVTLRFVDELKDVGADLVELFGVIG